jgi:acetyl-CoA synthetase
VRWQTLHKPGRYRGLSPNVEDYEAERATFSWDAAKGALDGLPGGRGLNIAHEAVDRHAAGPRRQRTALRCLDRHGESTDVTYADLAERSSRFANVLDALGVQAGERVFVLMPRNADLYVAALGTLKHRSVLCPLFAGLLLQSWVMIQPPMEAEGRCLLG